MSPPTVALACPHCRGSFDYEFVPGTSLTAVRLGRSRYMRCPLCRQYATFRVDGKSRREGRERLGSSEVFSDRQHVVRWAAFFVAPVVAAVIAAGVLLPWPEPAGWASAVGIAVLAFGSVVFLLVGAPPRRARSN
ncbi:MAG: hypothetical protein ACLQD8_00460 [Thermoplasmata archaeon]